MPIMKKTPFVRVGVIGLGQIALKAHLPGYAKAPNGKLFAVYSSRMGHAKEVARQYGIPAIFTDWRRLLESDQVDAVSICTPNFTHAPIALKAFQEGKHVLLEKPIALNLAEAAQIIQAGKKAGKVLMMHHNMRFDPAVRTAEKFLRKGMIGDVMAFKSSLTHRGPQAWNPKAKWFFNKSESGGGALMDLGPHVFDSLSFLLGDQARIVGTAGFWGKAGLNQGELHCSALLRFNKGAVGTVNLGWVDTQYQNRFYFFGSKGSLSLNLAKGDPITVQFRKQEGKSHPALERDCFYPSLYEHFLDCILKGKSPWVTGEDGLRTLELIEAGYGFLRQKEVAAI